MKKDQPAGAAGPTRKGGTSGRRFLRIPTSITAVDMAVLGAILALGESTARAQEIRQQLGLKAAPGGAVEGGAALTQGEAAGFLGLSGENAEVLSLAALASRMLREMEKNLGTLRFGEGASKDPKAIDWGADPTVGDWKFSSNLPDFSRSVMREDGPLVDRPDEPVDGATQATTGRVTTREFLNDPEPYRVAKAGDSVTTDSPLGQEKFDQAIKAGGDVLELVRTLFKDEITDVMARVDPDSLDGTELAEIDYKEVTAEDVEGLDFVPIIAGGGGGGGVAVAGGGGGFGGFAIDGYVSGATVFWDVNGNFVLDAGEVSTTTAADGSYFLSGVTAGVGQIVVMGDGVDTNTGGSVGMMAASTSVSATDAVMVTPLTLLMSQGVSQEALKTALGVTGAEIDLANFDPVATLTAAAGGVEDAGRILLQAQQLFAVVNSVSNLAAGTGGDVASVMSQTVAAVASAGVDKFVGDFTTDGTNVDATKLAASNTALKGVLGEVMNVDLTDPNNSAIGEIFDAAALAVSNVNVVIGNQVRNPAEALSADSRAAALMSQNELVGQFKAIAALPDPSLAKAEVLSKLSAYSTVDGIKSNYIDLFKSVIQAQDAAGRGVIAGVDDVTVVVGAERAVSLSQLLQNDKNLGTGELRVLGVEPAGLTWQTLAGSESTTTDDEGEVTDRWFTLDLSAASERFDEGADVGSFIKVVIDGLTVSTRVEAADIGATTGATAANLAAKLVEAAGTHAQAFELTADGTQIELRRADGSEIKAASLQYAAKGASLDARVGDDGNLYITAADDLAGQQASIRYIVGNGNAQSVGIIRVSGNPQVKELALKSGASASVAEDGSIALGDRIELTGTNSSGVSQQLSVTLKAADAAYGQAAFASKAQTGFILNVPGLNPIELKLGVAESFSLPSDAAALLAKLAASTITLPADYKGNFSLGYMLTSTKGSFAAASISGSDSLSVTGVAAGDSPEVLYALGTSDAYGSLTTNAEDTILPLVVSPAASQQFKIKLSGGDLDESRWVEIRNLPEGIAKVVLTYADGRQVDVTSAVSLGVLRIDEPSNLKGQAITVRLEAQSSLLDSSFGLTTTPILIQSFNQEAGTGAIASGVAQAFNFDIGGAYGLVVVAQSLTESLEDVAADFGGLTVASVSAGAKVLATIKIPSEFVLSKGGVVQTAQSVDGSLSVYVLTSTSNLDDASTGPLAFLSGLTLLGPNNYKTTGTDQVSALVNITALNDSDEVLGSVDKTLSFTFAPQADAVTYNLTSAGRDGFEDYGLSLAELFVSGSVSRATLGDPGEELYYVVQDLPAGSRIISGLNADGSSIALDDVVTLRAANGIGRVSGDNLVLTADEAASAVLVMGANQSLAASTIKVFAYSQEPDTTSVSAFTPSVGNPVSVSLAAVADAPYLSVDAQVRGLVNATGLAAELVDKTQIQIPAVAYLNDTDGSESLWVRLSATEGGVDRTISSFSFGGLAASDGYLDTTFGAAGGYYLKASSLADLVITRPNNSGAFDGTFKVEAIAIEGLSSSATAQDAATFFSGTPTANLYAITDQTVDVEFLQPAGVPTVSMGAMAYGTSSGKHHLDFTLTVSPENAGDLVTVLMTGVPNTAASAAQFYLVDGATETRIGAPAEVAGVWVFDYATEIKQDGGGAASIRMVLPPGFNPTSEWKFDVTGFAVDSLGLTNAKSLALLSGDVTGVLPGGGVPSDALLDPVIIDVDGDGLSLVGVNDSFTFDLNADGQGDKIGWITSGTDDALLVLDKAGGLDAAIASGSVDGSFLVTEYLDGNPATSAIDDLFKVASRDGAQTGQAALILDEADLSAADFAGARLWFDNGDGVAQSGEFKAITGFSLDLAQYADNVARDASGAIVMEALPSGLSGSWDGASFDADSALYDVFLPVEIGGLTTNQAVAAKVLNDVGVAAADRKYYEDNLNGFDLGNALLESVVSSGGVVSSSAWVDKFNVDGDSAGAWAAISGGANVLLTVSSKQAGVSFNLSQGARLEGQPKETWLMLWDMDDDQSLQDLKLFAKDNFSGPLDLEFRATVVYTVQPEGAPFPQPASFTVARDVSLEITPEADRAIFKASNAFGSVGALDAVTDFVGTKVQEEVTTQRIALKGVSLEARDPGESVELTITPPSNFPAAAKIFYKGSEVTAVGGKYTISGQVDSGDIWVEVPAYASGSFSFDLSAVSRDGASTSAALTSKVAFTVTPVADAPTVSVSVVPGATEVSRATNFTVNATLTDTDGSEEISSVTLTLSMPGYTGSSGPVLTVGRANISFTKDSPGVYKALVPKSAFDAAAEGAVTRTLSGSITTPEYFDGTFSLSAQAVSVEKADLSARAPSTVVTASGTVAAVAQDLSVFDVKGTAVVAGQRITLDRLVTSLAAKDPDETILLQITPTGLRAGTELKLYEKVSGSWTLLDQSATSLTLAPFSDKSKLADYALVTDKLQPNLTLTLTASTLDGGGRANATAASVVSKTVSVASTPLYTPEVVSFDGLGQAPSTFSINEGGSGVLAFGVKVGNKLFPSGTKVNITGIDTNQFSVVSVADGSTVSDLSDVDASRLSKGLRITALDNNYVATALSLGISSSISYVVDGVTLPPEVSAPHSISFSVDPVTDGVTFVPSASGLEDVVTWGVASMISPTDPREELVSVTLTANAALEYSVDGVTYVALAQDTTFSNADVANLTVRPLADVNGAISLRLTAVVRDPGVAGQTAASEVTQSFDQALTVAAVSDAVALDVGSVSELLTFYADAGRTQPLVEAIEMDPMAAVGPSVFVSIGGFSSPDGKESVSAVLTGRAIVAGTKLYIPSVEEATFATTYQAEPSTVRGGYEIVVPGQGNVFAAINGTLVEAATSSIIGLNQVKLYAVSQDGSAAANFSVFDTDYIEFQSTGLPDAPVVGLGADLSISDLITQQIDTGYLRGNLSDWIHVPNLTEGQVVELRYGWSEAEPFDVSSLQFFDKDGNPFTPDAVALPSSGNGTEDVTVLRLTYQQFVGAEVRWPANNYGELALQARVGAIDGYVNNNVADGERFVYTPFVSIEMSQLHAGLANLTKASNSTSTTSGDDYIYVEGRGGSPTSTVIDGLDGRDVVDFDDVWMRDSANPGGMSVFADLNKGEYWTQNSAGSVTDTGVLQNVEVLIGGRGDDYLIGRGDSQVVQVLRGRAGDDYIVGGAGDDILEGGSGADILIGGAGADTYLISSGSGLEVIDDFAAVDQIVVRRGELSKSDLALVRVSALDPAESTTIAQLVSLAVSTEDWVIRAVTGVGPNQGLSFDASFAVLLGGTSGRAEVEVLASVFDAADIDTEFDVLDPVSKAPVVMIDGDHSPVPLKTIVAESLEGEVDNAALNEYFGDQQNFDDIAVTLGAIADANFQLAYGFSDASNEMTGLGAVAVSGYKGFSGTVNDDVLIANDSDSVLYGGVGGSDRLIGGAGDDVLIASLDSSRVSGDVVSLTGGAGADTFAFIKTEPDEIGGTLNSIYQVRIEDFNRGEGDRVLLTGYSDSTIPADVVRIGETTTSADGRYEQSVTFLQDSSLNDGLTVVFDISFMRQFDSEFQLRLADFDAL